MLCPPRTQSNGFPLCTKLCLLDIGRRAYGFLALERGRIDRLDDSPAILEVNTSTTRRCVRSGSLPTGKIGRLLLRGMGIEPIADELGLDRKTAMKYAAEVKRAWASELEDTSGLRALLFSMAMELYERIWEWLPEAAPRNKPAYIREARGCISAMLDVTGLRQMTVNH